MTELLPEMSGNLADFAYNSRIGKCLRSVIRHHPENDGTASDFQISTYFLTAFTRQRHFRPVWKSELRYLAVGSTFRGIKNDEYEFDLIKRNFRKRNDFGLQSDRSDEERDGIAERASERKKSDAASYERFWSVRSGR